jgi:hypothetical protein
MNVIHRVSLPEYFRILTILLILWRKAFDRMYRIYRIKVFSV